MPQHWKTYKLGDLISINSNNLKRGQYDWINYIDIKSVSSGTYGDPTFYEIGSEPSRAKRVLKVGDTVISSVRPNLKAFFYCQNLPENAIASTGFAVLSPNKIDPRFLYYLTTNDNYTEYLVKSCTGSAYPAFNPSVILDSIVTIPESIEEQRAIASILSVLDDKIELNLQMNKTLEEMAMALYKHWFVDFGHFKDGKFVESELGMIPEGWEVGKLNRLIEVKYGKDHKKLESGNIPVYGSGGIMRFVDTYLYDQESILIPRKGSLGNLFYMMKPFWSVDTMFYSKFKMAEYGKYIFHFLKTQDLASMDVGSAIPSLTTELLNKIDILIPPKTEVIRFDEVVSEYFRLIEANKIENEILKAQRDLLLPKLITGEIAVKK